MDREHVVEEQGGDVDHALDEVDCDAVAGGHLRVVGVDPEAESRNEYPPTLL